MRAPAVDSARRSHGRPSVILSTIDEGKSDVKIRVGGSINSAKGENFI